MASRSLIRRDPRMQDLLDFRRDFDDIFSHFFQPTSWERSWPNLVSWIPPVETYIEQNRFHARLAVPGVKPEEVKIQAHGNQLTISGERRQERNSDDQYLQREFSYGAFERVITLPEGVQADQIEASCDRGVLDIVAPIGEKAMPRRIEVKSGKSAIGGAGPERKQESQAGERKAA